MVPKPSAKVLCGVPKHTKAAMRLREKIQVLDKLGAGMSHRAAGCEFHVNEWTTHTAQVSFNRNAHTTTRSATWLMKML